MSLIMDKLRAQVDKDHKQLHEALDLIAPLLEKVWIDPDQIEIRKTWEKLDQHVIKTSSEAFKNGHFIFGDDLLDPFVDGRLQKEAAIKFNRPFPEYERARDLANEYGWLVDETDHLGQVTMVRNPATGLKISLRQFALDQEEACGKDWHLRVLNKTKTPPS